MTEPMSPERLEQIEARLRTLQKQASGPEWPSVEDQWEAVEDETHGQGWGLVYGESSISPIASTYCMGVAELIAESHEVVPELLAETKRAREQEAFLRGALEQVQAIFSLDADSDEGVEYITWVSPRGTGIAGCVHPELAAFLRSQEPAREVE